MSISIIKADNSYLDDCSDVLKYSELGEKYFIDGHGNYIGIQLLAEGFEHDEMYVSWDTDTNEILGFSWIEKRGSFKWFPFLHVVAVKSVKRGMGIGKLHMAHFENLCRNEYKIDKGFLIVGEDNIPAISLYKKLGYKTVGKLPDLFIEGVNEIFMYKEIDNEA